MIIIIIDITSSPGWMSCFATKEEIKPNLQKNIQPCQILFYLPKFYFTFQNLQNIFKTFKRYSTLKNLKKKILNQYQVIFKLFCRISAPWMVDPAPAAVWRKGMICLQFNQFWTSQNNSINSKSNANISNKFNQF